MTNKVLLYESSQPYDKNETRASAYWKELSHFIGVSKPFTAPKRATSSRNKGFAIDICDDKFVELRAELIDIGMAASAWIQMYFITHPDVTISSPEYFKEMLDSWKEDPCEQKE
jgi:hypothetical protein